MAARWVLPKGPMDSRHRYYPVLIGNLPDVVYAVAGAIAIKWLRWPSGFWSALVIMLALTIGTLVLTWYEEYNSRKLTS